MPKTNVRCIRRGHAVRLFSRKWSATRSRCITERNSFPCTSRKTWWAISSANSPPPERSKGTAPVAARTGLSRPPVLRRRLRPVRRLDKGNLEMISKATGRFIRMSPQKARLVVDLIRGKDVNEALMTLKFTNKKATDEIEKVVKSAVANATQKSENIDVDKLFIETAFINEGPRLKRIRPAPMGRAYRYQRRTAHITIELGEKQ